MDAISAFWQVHYAAGYSLATTIIRRRGNTLINSRSWYNYTSGQKRSLFPIFSSFINKQPHFLSPFRCCTGVDNRVRAYQASMLSVDEPLCSPATGIAREWWCEVAKTLPGRGWPAGHLPCALVTNALYSATQGIHISNTCASGIYLQPPLLPYFISTFSPSYNIMTIFPISSVNFSFLLS
jgi:hypothetical protein